MARRATRQPPASWHRASLLQIGVIAALAAWSVAIPTASASGVPHRAALTAASPFPPFQGAPSTTCPPPYKVAQSWAPPATSPLRTIALTFDDGPGPDTQQIIDILESFHVRATFFNIGADMVERPTLVQELNKDGFLLGDHTMDHPNLLTLPTAQEASQIDGVINEQRQLTGTSPCVFRPPFGDWDSTTQAIAASRQMTLWLWNVDTKDWAENGSGTTASVQQVVSAAETLGIAQKHPVILMHDRALPLPATVAALPVIIRFFIAHGYTFVDLLGRSGAPGSCGPSSGESAEVPGVTLDPGATLAPGQTLVSHNGQFQLEMRGDGNLVLRLTAGRVLWSTHTKGNPGASMALDPSGELAVRAATGAVLWSSKTGGNPGAQLVLGDDGDLQIEHGATSVWSSRSRLTRLGVGESLAPGWLLSSPNGRCHLTQLSSGELVLTDSTGQVLWSVSGGAVGASTILTSDGALRVVDPSDVIAWDSKTVGRANRVHLTNSGRLMISTAVGAPTWETP